MPPRREERDSAPSRNSNKPQLQQGDNKNMYLDSFQMPPREGGKLPSIRAVPKNNFANQYSQNAALDVRNQVSKKN